MSGHPALCDFHFSDSSEDAEQSPPPIPTQRPDQRPLPTSPLTPSPGAATTTSQYLTYFPDSWIASPASPPSSSSSRTSVTPTRLQLPSSIVSRETPKPWGTADSSTSPPLSPPHIPLNSVVSARSSPRLSQTTILPTNSIPSTAKTRNTSWASQTNSHDSLVRQNHENWIIALRNGVIVQSSPFLKQERPIAHEEKHTLIPSQLTDPRGVPSRMGLQEDLQGLEPNNTDWKVDHATNDKVDYVEVIEEDDFDERYGDIPHRAPPVSLTYST